MRTAEINRKTKETDVSLSIDLDGSGVSDIDTGIGFFNHMLESFAKHSMIDLNLSCKGDLMVDSHHTIEDCGIVIGSGIKKALGDKAGIARYADATIPMDEALALCAIDLSGRAYLSFEAAFNMERVGYLDTEMVEEFFYAIVVNGMLNLHIREIAGKNTHHIIEAIFKSFGVALRKAITKDDRIVGTLSTKGVL